MTWNAVDNKPVHLILEDAVLQHQLINLLAKLTSNIKSFKDVDTFLSEPLSEAPACLITEINVSDIDSITFIKQMRNHGISTPVIVISDGNDGVEIAVQAIRAGAEDFVTKPIIERDFLERVKSALSHN